MKKNLSFLCTILHLHSFIIGTPTKANLQRGIHRLLIERESLFQQACPTKPPVSDACGTKPPKGGREKSRLQRAITELQRQNEMQRNKKKGQSSATHYLKIPSISIET